MAVRYLLDTNICIYIAKHNPPAVRARFEQLSADALAMSVITLGELQHGAEKSQARAKALVALEQLQSAIQVMPLTLQPAESDYLFHRMFALINLILNARARAASEESFNMPADFMQTGRADTPPQEREAF